MSPSTFTAMGNPAVYSGICQGSRQAWSSQWFERGHHAVFNPGTSKPLAVSLWFNPYSGGTVFSKVGECELSLESSGKVVLRVATNTGGGSWDKVVEASPASSSLSSSSWSHVLFWIVPGVEIGVCLDGGAPDTEPLSPGQAARVVGGEVRIGYPPPPPSSSHYSSWYHSSSYPPGSWLMAPAMLSEPLPYMGLVDEIAVFNAVLDSGWRAMLWNGGYGNFWHAGSQTWGACGWWSSSWNYSSSWHYPSSHHSSSWHYPSSWPMRAGGERPVAKSAAKPVTAELLERSLSEAPEQVLCQYVWGARSGHRDELILRDRDATGGGVLDERLYCVMDYFDPVAVVDAEGGVVERYGWTAFGRREVMGPDWSPRAGSEFGWSFGFHGQFLDVETGYYNYGYRYYVPWLGRWPNRDPIGEEGGVNLYGYTDNGGVNKLDYLGKFVAADEDSRNYCAAQLVGRFNLVYYFNHPDSDPGVQAIRQDLVSQFGDPGGELWARGVWECARTSFMRESLCPDFECIWGAVVNFAIGVGKGELESATAMSIIDRYWNVFVRSHLINTACTLYKVYNGYG